MTFQRKRALIEGASRVIERGSRKKPEIDGEQVRTSRETRKTDGSNPTTHVRDT
jgi:hypothetical protein